MICPVRLRCQRSSILTPFAKREMGYELSVEEISGYGSNRSLKFRNLQRTLKGIDLQDVKSCMCQTYRDDENEDNKSQRFKRVSD